MMDEIGLTVHDRKECDYGRTSSTHAKGGDIMYSREQIMAAATSVLSEQEATIAYARLLSQPPLTLDEIETRYKVSRQELMSIEKRMIDYMRNRVH